MVWEWLQMCLDKKTVRRAFKYSIVVGSILVVINHGDTLIRGEVGGQQVVQMLLTYLVPYTVSTLSSVGAIREMRAD